MICELFGDVGDWPDQDLIGFTAGLDADLTLAAYASGVFPMPLHESGYEGIGWWSPMRRGILPLSGLHVSRSLRKSLGRYTTSVDRAFARVLDGCADPSRPHGWIDEDIRAVYTELHERGRVHSVETWDGRGRLVGGEPGIGDGEISDVGWFPAGRLPAPRQARLAAQVRICLDDPRDVVLGLERR